MTTLKKEQDRFIDDIEKEEQGFDELVESESEMPETITIKDIKKVPRGDKCPDGELFSEKTAWKVFHVGNKKLSFMNGLGVDAKLSNRDDIRKQFWKGEISSCSIQNINADTTYRIKFLYYEDYAE